MIWAALTAAGGFLKRVPWPIYAALAIIAACWAWGNHRYSQGVEHERAVWEARIAADKARAAKADAVAADQRLADERTNTATTKERTDAIDHATPGVAPDDANLRLACARLRQAGVDTPAACR